MSPHDNRNEKPSTATDRYLTRRQAAELMTFSEGTLRNRAVAGLPPHPYRMGTRIVYSENEVRAFIESCRTRRAD